ncbi:MAG: GntR family transcriptional regulator [Ideonella sp.]|nr:GntR family transcriptional regulator [Ideonella sp.]
MTTLTTPSAKPAASALQAIRPVPVKRARRSGLAPEAARAPGGAALLDVGGQGDAVPTSTRRIAESITAAIVERRLMPGTKLAEQQIADIFKVSRTVVRQALNQLSRDRLVTLEPARGAFVREPSIEEARQVFEVRALLEEGLVRQLCERITDAQIAELRTHLRAEAQAVARTDVTGRTRLLADFHVVLAHMLGNGVLGQLLADLLSRSSLIALMYQSAHSAEHSQLDHVRIVDALAARDKRLAVRLMRDHLANVEKNLRRHPRFPNLASALQPHGT